MVPSARTVVYSLTAILLAAVPFLEGDRCDQKSQTPPDPLEGSRSGSSGGEYLFTHWSDVDREGDLNRFIYRVRNDHETHLLPVEWLNGKGEVMLAFQRLAPGACGTDETGTGMESVEDSEALVKFDPVTRSSKPAPCYVQVSRTPPTPTKPGPRKSRITAVLLDEDNRPYTLDIALTSEVIDGSVFRYEVLNSGEEDQAFVIPALSAAWDRVPQSQKNVTSGWRSPNGPIEAGSVPVFAAYMGEPTKFVVELELEVPLAETTVHLQVQTLRGEVVASGVVVVYLPAERR